MAGQQSHHDLAVECLDAAAKATRRGERLPAEGNLAAAQTHALLHLADAILVAGAAPVVDAPAPSRRPAGLGDGGYR